jgi:hypothetical protein
VKKKPEIQKTLGASLLSSHFCRNSSRSRKSVTQLPCGLSEGYDTRAHMAGICPMAMLLPIASSSALITTRPCVRHT